jgi:hypothetical protein
MAEIVTQLAIFAKNIPGALHELLRSLSDADINIHGIMVNDAVDHAVVRMVVDAPTKAIHILGDRGILVVESDIVSHEMPNLPGELMKLAGSLSRAKINISYIYGSASPDGGAPRIFFQTSNNKKVLGLLKQKTVARGKRR